MPTIILSTPIAAPVERVFDLARSIDAHVSSTGSTSERAVGGITSGLIEAGQSVTWEARHFGIKQRLSVRITNIQRPSFFEDEMISGAFRRMRHRHEFVPVADCTEMRDCFDFSAPLGVLGRVAEFAFLTRYMRRFLQSRAHVLKRIAESDEWRRYIKPA